MGSIFHLCMLLCVAFAYSVSSVPGSHHRMRRQGGKIVNGEDTKPHEFPSVVRLVRNGIHACGATILNRKWLLTAGHCVFDKLKGDLADPKIYTAVAGDHKASVRERSEQNRSITRFTIHQNYRSRYFYYFDVAVAEVEPPFRFNNDVAPANLVYYKGYESDNFVVTGWGVNDVPNNAIPDTQKKLQRPRIGKEECLKQLPDNSWLPNRVICTQNNGDSGHCFGDSGGPLYYVKNDDTQIQVGLVSGSGIRNFVGHSCTHGVGLYSRLSFHSGWIHRRISGCGNHPFRPPRNWNEEPYQEKSEIIVTV